MQHDRTDPENLPTEAAVQSDFTIPEDADYLPAADDEARRTVEGKG